jgi:hypothetical protein
MLLLLIVGKYGVGGANSDIKFMPSFVIIGFRNEMADIDRSMVA